MRFIGVFLSLLLLSALSGAQQISPGRDIRWPANCNNTTGMAYNFSNNTCVETGRQVEVTWDTTQPNLQNNYVACMGTSGVHRCPTNATAWNGIQIGNGPGTPATTSTLAINGNALCQFDGIVLKVGDFVQVSTTSAGTCHDTGSATAPTNAVPIIGQIVATVGTTTAMVLLSSTGGTGPMGPAGPPGGSLSYPGVVSDNNNGLNVTGATTTGSLPGYRQNTLNARSRNRDEVLQITITPQDMPGCAQSGQGLIDDQPCFNAAINYLSTLDVNVHKRLTIPYTQAGYTFLTPGYLQTLPFDWGDYHGSAGYNTQGSIGLQFQNGALISCSASGGTGYTPSASLPVYIQDPSLKGSGAYATAQTNTNGNITGCSVVTPGMNYPDFGEQAFLIPLGGDGAQANVPLSGNAIAVNTAAVTLGGNGYGAGSSLVVNAPGVNQTPAGLSCSTYPTFTALTANGVVTGITNTAGVNCTYQGNATATVPLYFGATCNGGNQCGLMAPETPVNQPCGVALINGLTIEGIGRPTIRSNWSSSSTTGLSNAMILFCDPTGIQSSSITIRNINLDSAMIGFYFPYEVHHLVMEEVAFGTQMNFPWYAYSFGGQFNYSLGPVNAPPLAPPLPVSTFRNIYSRAMGGPSCGGAWAGRNPFAPGGLESFYYGAYYGYLQSNGMGASGHTLNADNWGRCGYVRVEGYAEEEVSGAQPISTYDQWFETNIWHSQDGPTQTAVPLGVNANVFYTSGQSSCSITQTVVNRAVDYNFNYMNVNGGNQANYPYWTCYMGNMWGGFEQMPRYSQNDTTWAQPGASYSDVYMNEPQRPMFYGRFGSLVVNRAWAPYAGASGITDPYLVTGQAKAGIYSISYQAGYPKGRIEDALFTAPITTGVVSMGGGLPYNVATYIRDVTPAIPDASPVPSQLVYGNTPVGAPVATGAGTLNIQDSNAAGNSGGALTFSCCAGVGVSAQAMVGIRAASLTGSQNQGDMVFYTRRLNTDTNLTEAMRINRLGNTQFSGLIYATNFTVSTLAACNANSKFAEAIVTDATAPTYLGTLTGGGTVVTPVMCNGTAWVAY